MKQLLNALVFKTNKSKYFWVLLVVSASLPVVGALIINLLLIGMEWLMEFAGTPIDLSHLTQSALMNFSTSVTPASDVTLLSVIFVALFVTQEFSDGTIRNMFVANKSRKQIFASTSIGCYVATCLFQLADFAMRIVVFGLMFGFGNLTAGQVVTSLLVCFVSSLFVSIFVSACACYVAFATRKTMQSVVVPMLVCFLLPELLSTLVQIGVQTMPALGNVLSYEVLMWIPFGNSYLFDPTKPDFALVAILALYHTLFGTILFVLGYRKFAKADLK